MCQYHNDDRMNLNDYGPPEGPFAAVPDVDAVYVATAHIVGKTGRKSNILVTATGMDLKNHPHGKIAAKGRELRCALVVAHADDALLATEAQTLEWGTTAFSPSSGDRQVSHSGALNRTAIADDATTRLTHLWPLAKTNSRKLLARNFFRDEGVSVCQSLHLTPHAIAHPEAHRGPRANARRSVT